MTMLEKVRKLGLELSVSVVNVLNTTNNMTDSLKRDHDRDMAHFWQKGELFFAPRDCRVAGKGPKNKLSKIGRKKRMRRN